MEKRRASQEQRVYTIHPVPKHYAWGSKDRLQRMFHREDAEPLAEMWFSGHAQSPSEIEMPDGSLQPLTEVIREDPSHMVGKRGVDEFGPVLPFLFKVISADEPLSLQVHPQDFRARAGFNRENDAAIPQNAPERSFKDMNAKSEMVVALEPFHASVGFASRSFTLKNLAVLKNPVAVHMREALKGNGFGSRLGEVPDSAENTVSVDAMMPIAASVWPESRKKVFRAFHAAVCAEPLDPAELVQDLEFGRSQMESARNQLAFDFAIRAAKTFPGDPSVLALLMMNPLELEEGDAVFIQTGVPHAYIHGTGAEIMTNSDNVLRAGMTVKHKDIKNLLECLDCRSATPLDPADSRTGAFLMRNMVFYKPGVEEYMLAYGHASRESWHLVNSLAKRYDKLVQQMSGKVAFPHMGPRVVLCTAGEVECITEKDSRVLRQGEAVFVPASDGWTRVEPVEEDGRTGSYLVATTPF